MIDVEGTDLKAELLKKLGSNLKHQQAAVDATTELMRVVGDAENDREKIDTLLEQRARGWLLIATNLQNCLSREVNYGLIPVVDAWISHTFPFPDKYDGKKRSLSVTIRTDEDGAHAGIRRITEGASEAETEISRDFRHTYIDAGGKNGVELCIDDHRFLFAFFRMQEQAIKGSGVKRRWGGDGEPISRYSYDDVRRVCLPRQDHEKAPRSL